MRVNKYLAHNNGISRRQADDLVEAGSVTVNGNLAKHGTVVNDGDKVSVQGEDSNPNKNYTYIAFNKPVGYVCSRKEQDQAPTIYSLLSLEHQALKTVGRLDKDSSGLILLTDDGDFAQRMTHPKYNQEKIYHATLDKPLADKDLEALNSGVELKDGRSILKTSKLSDKKGYKITMHEGRNRQIRRTFGEIGYTITQLERVQFGPYELMGLKEGKFQQTNALK